MRGRDSARGWLKKTIVYVATNATWVLVIILILSLSSTAFSVRYLNNLQNDIDDLYENGVKGETYAQNANIDLIESESTAKDIVLADSQEARSASAANLALECNTLQSMVLKTTSTLNGARYRTLIARTKKDTATLVESMRSQVAIGFSTSEQARNVLATFQAVAAPVRTDISTINDLKRTANSRGLRIVQIQLRISLATAVVILLVSVAVRVFLYRTSQQSLRKKNN